MLSNRLQKQFAAPIPLFLSQDKGALKLELKPYLQPFERELALRELKALIGPDENIIEKFGYYIAYTDRSEILMRSRLTYWQRVGRHELFPTIQKALEFTQNGLAQSTNGESLHNARRLRYGPHDLHDYRGKFFPQLARSLINISGIPDDGVVLDPMCGSGTTTCEALAAGRTSLSADLNPLSVLITRAKAGVVLEDATAFRDILSGYLKAFAFDHPSDLTSVWPAADLEYLRRWFSPHAINDLAAIIVELRKIRRPFYRDFLRVCLSNIVRSVSWQKEVDLRVRKEVRPYKSGTAIAGFTSEVEEQIDRIYPYLCVLPTQQPLPVLHIEQGDSVQLESLLPRYRGKVDLIVTSPPYATALPYLDTDRLSLVILGLLPRGKQKAVEARMIGTREVSEKEREESWQEFRRRERELPKNVTRLIHEIAAHNHGPEVGFRRRNLPALLGRYFLAMRDAMLSARSMMRLNGRAYYVVGNNSSTVDGEKIEIPTDEFLFEIGASVGWGQDEMISMELLTSRDIFKENRGSAETILCFTAR